MHKRQPLSDLVQAVFQVAAEQIVVPEAYRYLTTKFRDMNFSLLSEREQEIVGWIGKGLTSEEIDTGINLSVNTLEGHRKKIFLKLNVKNVAGMILEASKLGCLR